MEQNNTTTSFETTAETRIQELENELHVMSELAASRLTQIAYLDEQLKTQSPADMLMTALQTALVNNPEFMQAIITQVSTQIDIDYEKLAESIDYYDLSKEIDVDDVASQFDVGDIADWVTIDYDDLARHISYTDLACELDYSDLAANINYEDTVDEVVREKLADLQIRNCTINFS